MKPERTFAVVQAAATASFGGPATLTVAAAAAELGVSPDTVVRWIEAGHLAAFVPPGRELGDSRPGPKNLLIFKTDWAAFLRSRTRVGVAPAPQPMAAARAPDAEAGSDGISRLRRGPRRAAPPR